MAALLCLASTLGASRFFFWWPTTQRPQGRGLLSLLSRGVLQHVQVDVAQAFRQSQHASWPEWAGPFGMIGPTWL